MLRCFVLLSLCLHVIADSHSESESQLVVNIPLEEAQRPPLGGSLTLPCFCEGHSADSSYRIKWSLITREKSMTILVVKEGQMRINENYLGRVHLVGYLTTPNDASIRISGLRSSDSGFFRCEVQHDTKDGHDFVYVDVQGIVFHYRAITGRYSLTFEKAQVACSHSSAAVASLEQLQAAFDDGLHQCDAGWISDHTVRYPIQDPHANCYGGQSPGIMTYGVKNLTETYDVYCFAEKMIGRVFYTTSEEKYTYSGAIKACFNHGAVLATTGQLYLAWQDGMDVCNAGWIMDSSVRYPINILRSQCGGGRLGVQTIYLYANRTGYPNPESLYDAFCYKEFSEGEEEDYGDIKIEIHNKTSEDEDQFTIVDLNYAEGAGVIFHYRKPSRRYDFTYVEAQMACINMGASVATAEQMEAAYEAGYHHCDAGWVLDQTSRYPIVYPRAECDGNLGNLPGVRSYGLRPANERYDVYCHIDGIDGEVFHVGSTEGFTFTEAASRCVEQNARLASTAELYAAWKVGYDKCRAGWLSDGSVRYPINKATDACGRGKVGVHSVYVDNSQTTLPDSTARYDVYCYRGSGDSGSGSGDSGSGSGDSGSGSGDSGSGSGDSGSGSGDSGSGSGDSGSGSGDSGSGSGDSGSGLDVCLSNPCTNGATCIETADSYKCLCLPSYGGDHCQLDEHQCEDGWTKFQGNCYLYVPETETWLDAELHCRNLNSHLVCIITPEEQTFVNANARVAQWIGLQDKIIHNDFRWIDGTPLQYVNWKHSQPNQDPSSNEDCVVLLGNGEWDDTSCDNQQTYTCKKSSVSCGSPPTVENAYMFGKKDYYPIHAIIRYQCNSGFLQYHLPVIHCKSDGQWEEPQVQCIEGIARKRRSAQVTSKIH